MYSVRGSSLLIAALLSPLLMQCSSMPKPPLDALTPGQANPICVGFDLRDHAFWKAPPESEARLPAHIRFPREIPCYAAEMPRTLDLCPRSFKGSDIATAPEYDRLRSFFWVDCLPPPSN